MAPSLERLKRIPPSVIVLILIGIVVVAAVLDAIIVTIITVINEAGSTFSSSLAYNFGIHSPFFWTIIILIVILAVLFYLKFRRKPENSDSQKPPTT